MIQQQFETLVADSGTSLTDEALPSGLAGDHFSTKWRDVIGVAGSVGYPALSASNKEA